MKGSTRILCQVRKPKEKQENHQSKRMSEGKKRLGCSILDITSIFDKRNTRPRSKLMELSSEKLEIGSDWYVWSLYWDSVPLPVKKLHTLVKVSDDKLDEKDPVASKSNLIVGEIDYRERRQALLFCVNFMLSRTNNEMRRQLSWSVVEWEDAPRDGIELEVLVSR